MMYKKPLVSVALCTFNGEKYLKKQLDSILKQDYPNLEIIISDDCSIDGTIEILESYSLNNKNIRYWKNEVNLGFNQNFKKAIDNCSGNLIAIADQDDVWLGNKISLLVENIGDNYLIYHDSEFIDNEDNFTGKSTLSHHRFVKGQCSKNLLYYNCVSGHTCLFKRELLTLMTDFPEKIYYDWWLAYTAACTGRLNYIKDKLVLHRRHVESSTGRDRTDSKTLRIAHLNLFLNHPLTSKQLKNLIEMLLNGYRELNKRDFSFKLFKLLMYNAYSLFYIRKRSAFSLFRLILKESKANN